MMMPIVSPSAPTFSAIASLERLVQIVYKPYSLLDKYRQFTINTITYVFSGGFYQTHGLRYLVAKQC